MWRSVIACLAALTVSSIQAAGSGLKPGLWEMRVIKQVIDGRDTSSQIAAATSQMQQALANMPPEQRARTEAILNQRDGSAIRRNGAIRMCISQEMASRDTPLIDKEGRCQPASVKRSGNRTTYIFNCTSDGVTTAGTGDSTVTGDLITSKVDATMHEANGETHVIQNETEMRFLGSDCGDVKPIALPKPSQ